MNGTETLMIQDTGVLESVQRRAKKVVKALESESWRAAEGAGVA